MATAQVVQDKRPVKTALHQAVLDERLRQVRILVSKHHANVDSRDMYGRAPLMLACLLENENDGYKMAKIFVRAGALLSLRDNMGRTALAYACMRGREKIVRGILREDVLDINEPDNDGNTPLMHAAMSGNTTVVEMVVKTLLKFGLGVDARNNLGYSALLLAAKYGNYNSAYIILTDGGASPTIRDNELFLNAFEWATSSSSLHDQFTKQRALTISPTTDVDSLTHKPQKQKLGDIYRRTKSPQCNHVKSSDPFRIPWDTGRLPAIYSEHRHHPSESVELTQGKNPRQRFLEKLQNVQGTGKFRPITTSAVRSRSSRAAPSSAKLLAFSAPPVRAKTVIHTVKSDIRTLFKIYAYQHVDHKRPVTVAGGESFIVRHAAPSAGGQVVCGMKRLAFHSPILEEESVRSMSH
ncbi:uncharacterized protein LOC135486657 [Lineus longissimus]|uniref:uncharacterized protein LOC135486657 n=1 Tax=Lineus longissimus TaxID=88925 RepID=UPI00315D9EE7